MKETIRKIFLCSGSYDVTYDRDEDNYGFIEYDNQVINISPGPEHSEDEYNEFSMLRTLYHEIMHGIFKIRFKDDPVIGSLRHEDEERLVDGLANCILELHVDNPHLTNLVLRKAKEKLGEYLTMGSDE